MAHKPLISIIVPVYNTLPFLGACLDSLLGQTCDDIEVICIDDGSTDGSAEALDAYASSDARVKVTHQANAGVSAARNAGLDQAEGTFVLFVDSDDYIDRYACQKLANVARRDHADIVIFGGETFPSVTWIDESMATIDATYHEGGLDALFLARGAYPLMCNKLYRRSLLEKDHQRFETTLSLGEDHAFQFCVFPEAKVVSSVRDHIYHYRCGRAGSALSTSEADRSRRANQHLAMVSYVLTRWDEAGLLYAKPAELSVWMCEFLLSTVRELTYEQRVQFAASYQELVERFDLTKSILSTPAAASRHRSLCVSAEDEPQVSAIVVPSPGRPGQEACIASLLTQELAQLEVICVDGTESGMPEAFAGDARVRTAASLADAFAQARGELTLLAESGDAYEAYALRIMADTAREGDACADVVTIQDRGGSLRVADLSAFLHATSQDGSLRETTWTRTRLAFDELPQSPAELFSLSASNKLWRTAFAAVHLAEGVDPRAVGRALLAAQSFCPISQPYFEQGVIAQISAAEARDLSKTQVASLVALKGEVSHETLCRAALALCMGTCERIAGYDAAVAYLDGFSLYSLSQQVLTTDETWWPTNSADYEALQAVRAEGAAAYLGEGGAAAFARRYQDGAEHRSRHAEYRRGLSLEREWRMQALESVSFRLGRMITQAPRLARDVLNSTLRR